MTDIIAQILVEVLNIFGIATMELKRGLTSRFPTGCNKNLYQTETARRKVSEEIGQDD